MSGCSSSLSSLSASSALSVLSRSHSPPVDYPSPPFTSDSEPPSSPRVRPRDVLDDGEQDGQPPAKRQKIIKVKEMTTEYLDLQLLSETDDEAHHIDNDGKLKKLMEVIRTKKKIVVIAGAGISVSAGIPDFRSSRGLFATLRDTHKLKSSGKHLFDADVYRNDDSTNAFHDMVRELSHLTENAKPTPFHHMIATLAEEGRLLRLYTQNVDGIDTALPPLATKVPLNSKGPWPKAIQLHGGLGKMVCSKCNFLLDFNGALFEGPDAPPCPECETIEKVREVSGLRGHGVGRLRPRMVLYNEHNPDEDAIGAVSAADLKTRPDAVIVVGTSLKVPGIRRLAKELCAVTRGRRGGFTAWINFDSEPTGADFKDCWDLVVRGPCDEIARFAALPKWNDTDVGEYVIIEQGVASSIISHPEVILDLKHIKSIKMKGMITPVTSSREQTPIANIAQKLKQAQLPFGPAPAATAEKSKKKKAARKPLPSKAPNRITNTFAVTKKNPVGRPKKNPVDIPKKNPVDIPKKNPVDIPKKNPVGRPKKNPVDIPKKNPVGRPKKNPVDVPKKNPVGRPKKNPVGIPKKNPVGRPKKNAGIESQNSGALTPKVGNPGKKIEVSIDSKSFDRNETISPSSKPSGMANLIS